MTSGGRDAHASNSVGAILPKDASARPHLENGDMRYLTEAPNGHRITAIDPAFGVQMTAARRIMTTRRASSS